MFDLIESINEDQLKLIINRYLEWYLFLEKEDLLHIDKLQHIISVYIKQFNIIG